MNRDDVARAIRDHGIETVKIGTPDMDGVFRGKRVSAKQFLDGCDGPGFAQCDVIFGWDIAEELITGANLAIGSADTGFADILLRPDLATFRVVPWEPATAAVVCDAYDEHGEIVAQSPRAVLRRVIDRAAAVGYEAQMAVEYEFRIFRGDQQSLRAKDYAPQGIDPLNPGLNCYSISHASIDESVVGAVRRYMDAYGIEIEGYNREHGEGMYEMNIRYAPALEAADRGMLFKSGAKEILAQAGCTPTFMAKYADDVDGCSGHLHASLWRDGANAFWDASGEHHIAPVMSSFVGGLLDTLPEFLALYAPNINSYKRYVSGSWAPTAATWGIENRTAAIRAIAPNANGVRVENRTPGADVCAYLGFAACLAGGLSGVERNLAPPPPIQSDVYKSEGLPPLPATLEHAIDLFDASATAREWFGDAFVDHYVAMRRWEIERHRRAVTAWERRRYFEQV
ncbi:MAG TPA: glutamine synthetase family protein [Dehalococcoidia bacterium]|jgi:glutamine synthetase|nr:glutamine synthetase family protein [Dehalococcoidia bacterium]